MESNNQNDTDTFVFSTFDLDVSKKCIDTIIHSAEAFNRLLREDRNGKYIPSLHSQLNQLKRAVAILGVMLPNE